MSRPHRPRKQRQSEHTVVKIKGSGKYPAPEQAVFTFPEGAFYGNMFKPAMLKLKCKLSAAPGSNSLSCGPDGNEDACRIDLMSDIPLGICSEDLVALPYRDVYACYTYAQQVEDADTSVAALNMRLCDVPDATKTCFPHTPERCHYKNAGLNAQQGSHCDTIGNDGAFGHCMSQVDDTTRFEWIITTHLNAPCDLLGDGELCDDMLESMRPADPAPSALLVASPGRRGCGACSLRGGDGVLPPASFAAVLALLLRRRRRRHAG